jgi:hypothetical protein
MQKLEALDTRQRTITKAAKKEKKNIYRTMKMQTCSSKGRVYQTALRAHKTADNLIKLCAVDMSECMINRRKKSLRRFSC